MLHIRNVALATFAACLTTAWPGSVPPAAETAGAGSRGSLAAPPRKASLSGTPGSVRYPDGVMVRIRLRPGSDSEAHLKRILRQVARPSGEIRGREGRAWRVEFRAESLSTRTGDQIRRLPSVASFEPLTPTLDFGPKPGRSEVDASIARHRSRYEGFKKLLTPEQRHERAKEEKEEGAEIPGMDYWASYQHYLRLRAYPADQIDAGAYRRAMVEAEGLPAATVETPDRAPARWQFIGPKNLGLPMRQYGGRPPVSGRINAIAVHPSNANIVYIGTANGGIWKTIDGGTNWTPLTDNWTYLPVSTIAIDPRNPNKIFVGTGDFHGLRYPYGMGLLRSLDGGATWTDVTPSGMRNNFISAVAIHPDNSNLVLVTTGRGPNYRGKIWRSINGGASFSAALAVDGVYSDITYTLADQFGNRRWWAASGSPFQGMPGFLAYSDDNGATWFNLDLFNDQTFDYVGCVTASPTDPNTIYCMFPSRKIVGKTTDGGAHWTSIGAGIEGGDNDYNWSQAFYNYHLNVSWEQVGQNYVDVVYVAQIDLSLSPDGGRTWGSIGGPIWSQTNAAIHADQHAMAFANSNRVIYAGNDGGLYKGIYNPAGPSMAWTPLNKNLGITQFYWADWHPTNPNIMIGGTQDNGTPGSTGDLNNWLNGAPGDGGHCYIHPTNPNIRVMSSQFMSIWLTTTGFGPGRFNYISPNTGTQDKPFVTPVTPDPTNPMVFYTGDKWLHKCDLTAGRWTVKLGGATMLAPARGATVNAIAVSEKDPRVIYVGTTDGKLWMTRTGAGPWVSLTRAPLPNRVITSIDVHPRNPYDILVTVGGTGSGHLWRCANTLAPAWQDKSGSGFTRLPDAAAMSVTRNPWNPDNGWYVGTDLGIHSTLNGGASWADMARPYGLPNAGVNRVKWISGTGYLMAATFGRGMWRMPMARPGAVLFGLSAAPAAVRGGSPVPVTIELNGPAPLAGTAVALTDNSAFVAAPATARVLGDKRRVVVNVPTSRTTVRRTATITARLGAVSKSVVVTLNP